MKLNMRVLTLAVASALAIAACGGGGNNGSAPAPQNAAPTLTGLTALTVNQDTPTPGIGITINDDGGAAALTVNVKSESPEIVQPEGIQVTGSGSTRTIVVTPVADALGNALIRVTVTDAQGLATSAAFGVNVVAVERSVATYTSSTFALGENDSPAKVSGFTFVQDADGDNTFDPLLQ